MFNLTNTSNNPLRLSSGTYLTPGAAYRVKNVGDRERDYEARGWLSIIEDVKEAPKAAENNKPDGGTSK